MERVLGRGYDTYADLAKFNLILGGTIFSRQEYIEECKKELASYLPI